MNDNEQRDELEPEKILMDWMDENGVELHGATPAMLVSVLAAAGYRKPRTITTAEERDALREGSVVRDEDGDVIERLWGGWYFGDNNTVPNLPATVLHEPTT